MKIVKSTGLALLVALTAAGTAHADSVVINLTSEFSGSSSLPDGPSPWGSATFTDAGANTVTLTLARATTLGTGEFIRSWYFNLAPALTPTALSIAQNSGPVASTATRSGSDTDPAFRGDGGSFFDVRFDWPTGNNANRFDEDWTVATFTLSMSGLTAQAFADLGVGAGNSPNGLYTAAHVQGLGEDGGSAWLTGGLTVVPLPTAAWAGLAGLGMAGVAGWRRRQRADA